MIDDDDVQADPLIAHWVDNGWPLVARRAVSGEGAGVPLGLPLPPGKPKRRISVLAQSEEVVSIAPPPPLCSVRRVLPRPWWRTLEHLDLLSVLYAVELRVCGSVAWRAITGLDYLTERSDLDLLIYIQPDTDMREVTAALAAIESGACMRLDGELIRPDGAGVSWREFHARTPQVLMKSVRGVTLIEPTMFALGGIPA